jgi:taurine dioxygenase
MIITDITPDFGARITEIDLGMPISDSDWQIIDQAWNERGFLHFPNQFGLSYEAQVAFCSRFAPVLSCDAEGGKFEYISNVDSRAHASADAFHMDYSFREERLSFHMDYIFRDPPLSGICLYPLILPRQCTPTIFASNSAPLRRMHPEYRAKVERLTVRNVGDFASTSRDVVRYKAEPAKPDCPALEYPMVWPHPRTGTLLLSCTEMLTESVLTYTYDESRNTLQELFEKHLYAEENLYRHEWQLGDLVVWDNLAAQHCRGEAPASVGERTMRRVTFCHRPPSSESLDDYLKTSLAPAARTPNAGLEGR